MNENDDKCTRELEKNEVVRPEEQPSPLPLRVRRIRVQSGVKAGGWIVRFS
jgi:hypothetical protein